ncbi:MAG: hydroxymethylbilane synthase [Ferruginibacter sp.]|uniref:hydroxymethylbilane synthase n=1 Tax=Ferruginibacter sp. TaxID=1940288 RepID=UPI002657EA80|nr:hydroxymethylbilane synthase [Ferruginibacter sp.]MDB5279701.1 hydroxymethylbilane synthase [Ferruginibacter sp.]
MTKIIRIGTRESQLAVWQATLVQQLLAKNNQPAELVFIKSEGDIDLQTPLYEIGVQGIFTRSLDIALINNKIDIAVHSMKDVPTQLPKGIVQSAVLPRASYKDIFVYKGELSSIEDELGYDAGKWATHDSRFITHHSPFTIATSSIRRMAQWLNRYPNHSIENLRGNVNTRLRKVQENNWQGAIFAAAGLERINLRPEKSIELDWMLPAPAQGAIMIVCRDGDEVCLQACDLLNDAATATCAKIERDFLRTLLGGCSTPISALAEIKDDQIYFRGNILSADGKEKVSIDKWITHAEANEAGSVLANKILLNGGEKIALAIRNAK